MNADVGAIADSAVDSAADSAVNFAVDSAAAAAALADRKRQAALQMHRFIHSLTSRRRVPPGTTVERQYTGSNSLDCSDP